MNKIEKSLSMLDKVLLFIFLLIFNISAGIPDSALIMTSRWLVCIALTVFDFFYAIRFNNFKIKILPKPFFLLFFPLLVQCLWDLDSIPVTFSRSLSFIFYCGAIYFFMNRKNESPSYIQKVYLFFSAFTGIFVLIVDLYFIGNYSINGDFVGFYPNRNMTVSLLLSGLILFSNFILNSSFKLKKIIFLIYVMIMTYMIFITHSRMAFLCYLVMVLYFLMFVHTRKNTIRNIILFISIPFILSVLPTIGQIFDIESINRIFIKSTSDDSTGLGRDVWNIGFALIAEKPLLGWGANSVYYHTFIESMSRWGWGVHNSYLIMLIEGGIIGATFYILFFVKMFYRCWKSYQRSLEFIEPSEQIFVKICLLNCIVLLINGMSESFLFSAGNAMSLPFWFSLLTLYAYLDKKREMVQEN